MAESVILQRMDMFDAVLGPVCGGLGVQYKTSASARKDATQRQRLTPEQRDAAMLSALAATGIPIRDE